VVEFLVAFDKEANETVQRRRSENIASSRRETRMGWQGTSVLLPHLQEISNLPDERLYSCLFDQVEPGVNDRVFDYLVGDHQEGDGNQVPVELVDFNGYQRPQDKREVRRG
jgi:hypothetical protein